MTAIIHASFTILKLFLKCYDTFKAALVLFKTLNKLKNAFS